VIRILLIAILILLIARAFWRLVDGILESTGGTRRQRSKSASVKLVRDPVCGTYVQPRESLSLASRGSTHFFCSEECRSRFRNDPRR
jgi:YHS domain-containing protein